MTFAFEFESITDNTFKLTLRLPIGSMIFESVDMLEANRIIERYLKTQVRNGREAKEARKEA